MPSARHGQGSVKLWSLLDVDVLSVLVVWLWLFLIWVWFGSGCSQLWVWFGSGCSTAAAQKGKVSLNPHSCRIPNKTRNKSWLSHVSAICSASRNLWPNSVRGGETFRTPDRVRMTLHNPTFPKAARAQWISHPNQAKV